MLWISSPVGEIERMTGRKTGQEIGIGMVVIEVPIIGTPIETKVDHQVEIGTQDPLVDYLDIGIIEGIEIEIETEIIEETEVIQMMGMIIQDPEVVQELGIILI